MDTAHVGGHALKSGGIACRERDTLVHAESRVLPRSHLLDDFRSDPPFIKQQADYLRLPNLQEGRG